MNESASKNMKHAIITLVAITGMSLIVGGCDLFESTGKKQINACVEDIKLDLNDPNSLEIISTRPIKVNDGTHRIKIVFTAKNAFGGRVKSEELCGFKTEKDETLNPDDLYNKKRKIVRNLKSIGINFK